MIITRRKLAMLAATAVVIPAEAQSDADEETRSAHEQLRNNAIALAKVKVPIATEPAYHFKA